MRPLAEAAIQAGLVDDDTLAQFKRWGMVSKDTASGGVSSPEEAVDQIQEALEAEEQVRLQATDLDLLRYYMNPNNQLKGQIVLISDAADQRGTKTVTFVRRTLLDKDQFILPWMSEEVTELLVNGRSYLRWNHEGQKHRVRMVDYEDVYFGDTLMFLLCESMDDDGAE